MLENERLPADNVSTLLYKLLACLDTSAGVEVIHDPAVQKVLAATCSLQQLCWAQIPAGGDQLFAFLVNLYNLMWLHAVITLETTG